MASKDAHSVALARSRVNQFLQNAGKLRMEFLASSRIAFGDGVFAVSGKAGWEYADERYGVDLQRPGLRAEFYGMLESKQAGQAVERAPHLCAEANLWMTLRDLYLRTYGLAEQPIRRRSSRNAAGHGVRETLDLHGAPRHLHAAPGSVKVAVFRRTRKNTAKEDGPCPNCQEWARKAFLLVTGS